MGKRTGQCLAIAAVALCWMCMLAGAYLHIAVGDIQVGQLKAVLNRHCYEVRDSVAAEQFYAVELDDAHRDTTQPVITAIHFVGEVPSCQALVKDELYIRSCLESEVYIVGRWGNYPRLVSQFAYQCASCVYLISRIATIITVIAAVLCMVDIYVTYTVRSVLREQYGSVSAE